jgi:hypothetical protein
MKNELAVQLSHLPICVISRPLDAEALGNLITTCDGYLDLHPAPRVDPALLKAMMLGKPVVAGSSPDIEGHGGVDGISLTLQRMAEVSAHPDVEKDLAVALRDAVADEHSRETVSRSWRRQIEDSAVGQARKGSAAGCQGMDLENDQ